MTARERRAVHVRREEILEATVARIERVGLAEVRVSDVAAALGISPGLIFYHFQTKDGLLGSAFGHAFERDLADLELATADVDPLARLRRVAGLFDGPDAPLGWQLWIDACAVAHREPEIRAVMRRIDRHYAQTFRTVIEEGVAAGVFSCVDPAGSVERILALNDGLSTAVMVLGSVTRTQLREWMVSHIAAEVGIDAAALRASPLST